MKLRYARRATGPLRFHGGGNSERRSHEEVVLWEAAGPAGAVDLRGDGLEMCAGQDPVDAPSPVRPVKR